jgi:hypothetical protein
MNFQTFRVGEPPFQYFRARLVHLVRKADWDRSPKREGTQLGGATGAAPSPVTCTATAVPSNKRALLRIIGSPGYDAGGSLATLMNRRGSYAKLVSHVIVPRPKGLVR